MSGSVTDTHGLLVEAEEGGGAGERSASKEASPSHARGPARVVRGAAASGFAAVALLLLWRGHGAQREQSAPALAGLGDMQEKQEVYMEDGRACSAEGALCLDAKCCVDGGAKGLQCYAKNKFWAQCTSTCEKGVRKGETDGTYDRYGTFHPAEWSCEELGNRSEAACWAYDNATCPSPRCDWIKGISKCATACDTLSSLTSCQTKADHCAWHGDKCVNACSVFTERSCPSSRCEWKGKCIKACWEFHSQDTCDTTRCIWDGSCKVDPCSAPGEDCRETKCCSADRGGKGMTCFEKSEGWASCKESCDNSSDWSCNALGERTPFEVDCSWGGKDCSKTHLCCNNGFSCAVKDDLFTGCVQTVQKTTWVTKDIPIPGDWKGTILGGGRTEFTVQPAPEGAAVAGTSLYCIMAILPNSTEEALNGIAQKEKASIYGCEGHDIFHSWWSNKDGWDTGEATLANTDVFIDVFEHVRRKGAYLQHDWTVKVDADCVFVPDRLRYHLKALKPPAYTPIYIKNNGMDPGLGNNGFLGAIEIFSTKAMRYYFDNAEGCKNYFGFNCGEDGFFKGCMDAIGVGFMQDDQIFFPDRHSGSCSQENHVAFHPLKKPEQWQKCWDLIMHRAGWQNQR